MMTVTSRWPKDVVDVFDRFLRFSWTRYRRNGTRKVSFHSAINVILSTTGDSNWRTILYYHGPSNGDIHHHGR